MKTAMTLCAALALTTLAGCHHVSAASLQTRNLAISVGSKGSTAPARTVSRGGPPHCPPGHAKKGEC